MNQISDALQQSLIAFVATGIVVAVTVLIREVGFRPLFSEVAFMEKFRGPGLYTKNGPMRRWRGCHPPGIWPNLNQKFSIETVFLTEELTS